MQYLSLLFLSISSIAFSQDIIQKKNGDSITSKITEIGINEIKYYRYDNLDGPLYIIAKDEVVQIDFENGSTEYITITTDSKEFSLDDTKALIVELINSYGFERSGSYQYNASFDGKYLKLNQIKNTINTLARKFIIYDFSGECSFHRLSKRKADITFINVIVNRIIDMEAYDVESLAEVSDKNYQMRNEKFVIMVKGDENAEKLLDALKLYNEYFKKP